MLRHIKKFKSYKKLSNPRNSIGLIAIALVAGVGSYYLFGSRALSPYVSMEAESGTLTAPAYLDYDSTASGGQAVDFGTVSTGGGPSPLLLSFYPDGDYAAYPFTPTTISVPCHNGSSGCSEGAQSGIPDTYLWGKNEALMEAYSGGGWGPNAGGYGILDSIDTIADGSGTYSPGGVMDYPNPPSEIYRAVIGIGLVDGAQSCGGNGCTPYSSEDPQTDGLTIVNNGVPDTNPADYVNSAYSSQTDCALTNSSYPNGPYGGWFSQDAERIAQDGFKSPIIRLDWEMNGSWYFNDDAYGIQPDLPYTQDYQAFKQCWVNDVNALRAGWAQYGQGDGTLQIDFNPVLGDGVGGAGGYVNVPEQDCGPATGYAQPCSNFINDGCSTNTSSPYYDPKGCIATWTGLNWATIYPGDKYVDIIGLDAYDGGNPEYCSIGVSGCDGNGSPSDISNPSYLIDNTCVSPSDLDVTKPVTCTPAQAATQQTNWEENWQFMVGTPGTAANGFQDGSGGLTQQVAFAKAHDKPMSFPEWGVDTDIYPKGGSGDQGGDNAYYISQMLNWMTNKNNVNGYTNYYYESYFNANEQTTEFRITSGRFPNAEATMKTVFAPYAADRDPAAPNG